MSRNPSVITFPKGQYPKPPYSDIPVAGSPNAHLLKAPGDLNVFLSGGNGRLYANYWLAGRSDWYWENIGTIKYERGLTGYTALVQDSPGVVQTIKHEISHTGVYTHHWLHVLAWGDDDNLWELVFKGNSIKYEVEMEPNWRNLAAGAAFDVASAPSVLKFVGRIASTGLDYHQVRAFVSGRDGNLYRYDWDEYHGALWEDLGNPTPLGGKVVGKPAAIQGVSRDKLFAFVRGENGHLYMNRSDREHGEGGRTSDWVDCGLAGNGISRVTHSPAVACPKLIYVFVTGSDGGLYVYHQDGIQWNWLQRNQAFPSSTGVKVVGAPAAIAYLYDGQLQTYAFVRGSDGHLYVNFWDLATGGTWEWRDQGVPQSTLVAGDPGVGTYVHDGREHLYVFLRGDDNHLHVNFWNKRRWAWADQGRPPSP